MAREPILQNRAISHLRDASVDLRDATGFSNPNVPDLALAPNKDRDRTSAWHKADPNKEALAQSTVAKTVVAVKDMGEHSVQVGTNVIAGTINKALSLVKNGSKNGNIRDLAGLGIGSIFGLGFIKDLLGIPKMMTDPAYADKQSPILISGAKWAAGGTIAYGLLRGLLGGPGLSGAGLVAGLIAFIIPYALTNLYENENSIFGKLSSVMGLRTKITSLMDSLKFSNIIS